MTGFWERPVDTLPPTAGRFASARVAAARNRRPAATGTATARWSQRDCTCATSWSTTVLHPSWKPISACCRGRRIGVGRDGPVGAPARLIASRRKQGHCRGQASAGTQRWSAGRCPRKNVGIAGICPLAAVFSRITGTSLETSSNDGTTWKLVNGFLVQSYPVPSVRVTARLTVFRLCNYD